MSAAIVRFRCFPYCLQLYLLIPGKRGGGNGDRAGEGVVGEGGRGRGEREGEMARGSEPDVRYI